MMNDDNETSIMKVDENMDDIKDYVGTSDILESWNPPISSRYISSLTMSNFDAYMHSLKKFQRWPHSLLTMPGRWKKFHYAHSPSRQTPFNGLDYFFLHEGIENEWDAWGIVE